MDYYQQIIAVDTKFNKYRGNAITASGLNTNSSTFKKNYLKRRIQLLSNLNQQADAADDDNKKENIRKDINYLQIRTQLLRQHVRAQGLSDLLSTKSFSVSTGESKGISSTNQAQVAKKLSFASVSSEAYDFRGFHHLSDLHKDAVTSLMFAHNSSSLLIASSMDGTLSLHTLDTSPPGVSTTLSGHTAGVTDFDISTSNELLVSSSYDNTLCLWQLPGGKLLRRSSSSCGLGLTCCKFLPSNNNLVVTGSVGGLVQMINISTGIFCESGTTTVPGSVLCLAVSTQDDLVWTGTNKGTVVSFKVDRAGKLRKAHRIVVSESEAGVTSLVSRPSPSTGVTMLLVNAGNNYLLLYKVTDNLGALALHRKFPVVHSKLGVRSTFAPLMSYRSGECVVSASEDGGVFFFDVARTVSKCINKLQAHSCAALAVAFNFNESYLATSDESGLVIVWKR